MIIKAIAWINVSLFVYMEGKTLWCWLFFQYNGLAVRLQRGKIEAKPLMTLLMEWYQLWYRLSKKQCMFLTFLMRMVQGGDLCVFWSVTATSGYSDAMQHPSWWYFSAAVRACNVDRSSCYDTAYESLECLVYSCKDTCSRWSAFADSVSLERQTVHSI